MLTLNNPNYLEIIIDKNPAKNILNLLINNDSNLSQIFNGILLVEFAWAIWALAAVWTGLLYIFSMGNDEQASKAKKNFVLIISGLIILLSALGIITLVRNLLESAKLGG